MYLTTIAVRNNDEKVKAHIFSGLEEIKKSDINITHEEYTAGDTVFIKCGLKEGFMSKLVESKNSDEFRYSLAQILCDVIINNYESKILKKIIKDYYLYLTDSEKELIYENSLKLIRQEDESKDGFYGQTRRTKIIRKILNYLKSENFIIIDGFVNFRLTDYIKELGDIVDKVVEEYIAEKEYNEFIRLLRYFVEIQESKLDTINIIPSEEGNYFLIDSMKKPINCECFEELKSEIADSNINYDDLLISTLITIAPKKIIIHEPQCFKNKELLKTINNIFYDRTDICRECDICSSLKKNKELN